MSHAENKLNWCLKKAENELKEARKHFKNSLVPKDLDSVEI